MSKIELLSENLMLHYAAPDNNLVVEVLQMDASSLSAASDEQLSKYIAVLGQYLVMLQYNMNLKAVSYLLASKTFEHKLMVKTLQGGFPTTVKTDKAKRVLVIEQDPEMSKMRVEVLAAEAEKLILHNMDKAVESFLNALKKEKSTRPSSQQEY